jgi:hypothetical protein
VPTESFELANSYSGGEVQVLFIGARWIQSEICLNSTFCKTKSALPIVGMIPLAWMSRPEVGSI